MESPSPMLTTSGPPSPIATNFASQLPPSRPPSVRRVNWPAELPPRIHQHNRSNVSISMTPPAESREKEVQLTPATPGDDENPFDARYAVREGSMASADDAADQLDAVREQLEVWVDPNERDGLPTLMDSQAANEKKARALTRAFKTGAMGFLKQRKQGKPTADFQSGRGEGRDEEKGSAEAATPPLAAGGGILAALIALNAQTDSLPPSADPSPGHSAPTTPGGSPLPLSPVDSDDDSDDEIERERFLARQRAHRASKNAFHATSSAVAGATRSAAVSAFSLATGGASRPRSIDGGDRPFRRTQSSSTLYHTTSRASSPSPSRDNLLLPHQRSQSQASLPSALAAATFSPPTSPVHKSLSSSALSNLVATASRASSPSPPPSPGLHRPRIVKPGAGVAKQLRRLGGHLGLEVDTEATRPDAARSGAGVFGGLVMSTTNLAGAASPHANTLAPIPSKSGYHISRYKATPSKSLDLGRGHKSSENLPRLGGRPAFTRGRSADTVLRTSRPSSVSRPPSLGPKAGEEGFVEKTAEELYEEDEEPEMLSMPTRKKRGAGLKLHIQDMPPPTFRFGGLSSPGSASPRRESPLRENFFFSGRQYETDEERDQREWAKEKRKRRKLKEKRMRHEVFIVQHVATIIARQDFILKMARSFMMYGAPTHRLEAQIQATARVLELELQCIYLPGMMLISFSDSQTHTSDVKFLKQANGLDLGKIQAAFAIYNRVVRDKVGVTEAAIQLDELFLEPPKYKLWQQLIIGGLAGAFIMPSAFYGSFIDCLVAIPLGMLLVLVQVLCSRNDLYSSLFEIVIACLNAVLAAALARTKHFCFASVASGSVVLILPGYIVLCGALELANRSIIAGSVRLVYSVLYALFLGFGLSAGSEVYQRISGDQIEGSTDYTCAALRLHAPWYRATIPQWWYFLTIPAFLLMLGLRNGQPFYRKETVVMLLVGSAGFCCNFFSGRVFVNRPDITSAIGAFAIGLLSNLYGKSTRSSGFVIVVVAIFIQLPSGLLNGGLLKFASDASSGSVDAFSSGLSAAQTLVQVAIGLTVGLFVAAAVSNVFGGGRRRGGNLSSL